MVTFSWGFLLALAIFGLVSLSRQQHHHHKSHRSQPAVPAAADATGSSWDEVSKLAGYDSKSLRRFISPLVSISGSAYSSSDVPGWHKLRSLSPASDAGAHAVLYQEDSSSNNKKRLVLGFRGTLSQADSCVDRLFFGDTSPVFNLPSPSWCMSTFSNQSLDYLSQSLDYTRKVVNDFPDAPLLLTGHSLGAALAALVSVSLAGETGRVIPVVGFSAPGGRKVLQRRGVEISHGVEGSIVVIGDEWDLVVRAFWEQQLGTVCVLKHQEPSDCRACLAGDNTNLCSSCMFQTHGLNQITSLLDGGVRTNCTKTS